MSHQISAWSIVPALVQIGLLTLQLRHMAVKYMVSIRQGSYGKGMHGTDYTKVDYAKQYPSTRKFFIIGPGAANRAEYPAGSVPQDWARRDPHYQRATLRHGS